MNWKCTASAYTQYTVLYSAACEVQQETEALAQDEKSTFCVAVFHRVVYDNQGVCGTLEDISDELQLHKQIFVQVYFQSTFEVSHFTFVLRIHSSLTWCRQISV